MCNNLIKQSLGLRLDRQSRFVFVAVSIRHFDWAY